MTITLQTKSGVFEYDADADEKILFAGLRNGLTLPYECATGTCGTCRARVMEGDVDVGWPEAPGAERLKRDKGDILMCQAHARGDCVVRVPAQVERLGDGAVHPEQMKGRITRTQRLTGDVIDFDVELDRDVSFDAGQFMVAQAPGTQGGRAYSMVNYAPKTRQISFVVKRKPGGSFSDWLFEGDRAGQDIDLFGPLGKATFRPHEALDLVCITGGSGIAGIMSILNHASQINYFANRSGQLYFGVRTMADIFYAKELAAMVDKSGNALRVVLALSDEAPPADVHPDHPSIRLAQGFVHDVASESLAGIDSDNAIGFVAGPPPMVDGAIRVLLGAAKMTPARIRYDKFS